MSLRSTCGRRLFLSMAILSLMLAAPASASQLIERDATQVRLAVNSKGEALLTYGGRFHDLFGRLTYRGRPVYGLKTDRLGAPLDGYGRLVYLDTYDSRYGPGWRRENSFVAHNPTGIFCYGFYAFNAQSYPHPPGYPLAKLRGPANGSKYRLTVEGPGVTPDVSVVVPGLHDYNRSNPADVAYEQHQNALLDSIIGVDKLCRQH